MRSAALALVGPAGAKKIDNEQFWNDVTVTSTDTYTSRFRSSGMPELIARAGGTVAVCARINAQSLASLPFRLYKPTVKRKGIKRTPKGKWLTDTTPGFGPGAKAATMARDAEDFEEVTDHPLLDVLRHPNPHDPGYSFWELHHYQKEICGNAFKMIVQEGDPLTLYPMFPQFVRIEASRADFIGAYWYGRDRTVERRLEPEDVLHDKFAMSITNPYWGEGPLQAVIVEDTLRQKMNEYALATFDNRARPDTVFNFKDGLTEPQLKQARIQLDAMFKGAKKAGSYAIVSGGNTIETLGADMQELQYTESGDRIDSRIAAGFNIPETFLRPNDGALSQLRNAMIWYGRFGVLPRGAKFSEWLTEKYLPLFEGTEGWWFACDDPVPADEAADATRLVALVNGGILTPNESRVELGWEQSEDPAADALRVTAQPAMQSAVGTDKPQDANAKPVDASAPAAAAADPNAAPVQDTALNGAQVTALQGLVVSVAAGEIPLESAQALARVANPLVPEAAIVAIFSPLATFESKVPEPAPSPPQGNAPPPKPDQPSEPAKGGDPPTEPIEDRPPGGGPIKPTDPRRPGTEEGADPADEHPGKCSEWCSCHGQVSQKAQFLASKAELTPPESSMAGKVEQFFAVQKASVIGAMKAKPSGYKRGGPRLGRKADANEVDRLLRAWGVTGDDAVAKWRDMLAGYIKPETDAALQRAMVAGAAALQQMGAQLEKPPTEYTQATDPLSRRFIEKHTADLLNGIEGVNATTADKMAATLADGLDAGEPITKLRDRIASVYDSVGETGEPLSRVRANAIARTETSRAQDAGTIIGWQETGVVEGKTWMVSPTACEFCEAADAKYGSNPIPLDQAYYNLGDTVLGTAGGVMVIDFAPVYGGTLHPNCFCSSAPVLK